MKNLLYIVLIFLPFLTGAQLSLEEKNKIAALRIKIENASHDTTIIQAWIDWDNMIYVADPDLDLALNKKIDSLCEKNLAKKNSKKEKEFYVKSRSFALNNIGLIYKHQGDYALAIEYYEDGLALSESVDDKKGIANSYNNIANVYRNQGNYAKAIEYYMLALTLNEEIENKTGISMCLNNIGILYEFQGEYDKAVEYYSKSLEIDKELGNKKGIAASYGNIGNIYSDEFEYAKAIEYMMKSLELKKEMGNQSGIAITLINLGNVYKGLEDYDKAIEYYTESLQINEELGNLQGKAMCLNNIGVVYVKQNLHQEALKYCSKSLDISKELGAIIEIQNASKTLWEIYKTIGEPAKALEMHELYVVSKDSVLSMQNQKEVLNQAYKYAYEKQATADSIKAAEANKVKDALLAAEQAENKQHQLEAEQQELQKYYLIGFLGLALLFGGFIYNRFRVTRTQKNTIEDQKNIVDRAYDELEEKNKEILDSIVYAKRIQNAILPPPKLVKEYLSNSFVLYLPKDIVAGDFYWVEHRDDKILFAACDCTGHGVPGALVSVICVNGLNRSVREHGLTDPGKILDKTREMVIAEFEKSEDEVHDGMDVSLASLEGNKLEWAGANNPLWLVRNGELIVYKPDHQPIGKYTQPTPFTTHSIDLQKGDTIYVFTDGYQDQFGGDKGKKLKAANFKKLLLSIQGETMPNQKQIIEAHFNKWKGEFEQIDDVCVIGVRV
ncbi:tetratricopeptide repeat protein [Parvicella tangerina]|uniref:Photosystem I assembly protein Ycf3 n=1 Tax=Parvicella tangerina TaxID=2829795 RepID=A0A916JN85_9FLAO|nr:tetratricopeptide repeat protein [Parvicella tangerina]CAG5082352.1 Photosystem I assembly protein Ycf3 [Parvicella tangerina]